MPTLKVRALPCGEHRFFRRAGLAFPVGSSKLVQVDEQTAKLLLAEKTRLLVEEVDGAAAVIPDEPPQLPPALLEQLEEARRELEATAVSADRVHAEAMTARADATRQLEEARAALDAAETAKREAAEILKQAAAAKQEAERLAAAAAAPPPSDEASPRADGDAKKKGSAAK